MGMKLAKEWFYGKKGKSDSVETLQRAEAVYSRLHNAAPRQKEEQDEETQQNSQEGFGNGVHF